MSGATLLHVRPYGFEVGSVHKYGEMFARVTDVEDYVIPSFSEPVNKMAKTMERAKPRLVLVRGDRWDMWQAAKAAGIPYILDAHDIHSMRVPEAENRKFDERGQMENAAAIIFTSEDHLDYCSRRYDLPPSRVVHLRPLASALDFKPLPKKRGKHIVYAGGLTMAEAATGIYGYRSYGVSIFPALIAAGWKVHVYPCYLASDAIRNQFAQVGCIMHDEVPEDDLPRELSQFSVGIQSYANDDCFPAAFDYCMTCRPNKLWSYLAAGIPTVGFQGGNGTRLYDGSWGMVAHSLDELPAVAGHAAKMKIPEAVRRGQVMDGDEPKFRELVALALAKTETKRETQRRRAIEVTEPAPVTFRLANAKTFRGVEYPKGTRIDLPTAVAMKKAGMLTDERIPDTVPC